MEHERDEQVKSFLDKRIKQIREEYGHFTREERDCRAARVNDILMLLNDEDREWLDRYLVDDFIVLSEECEAYYLAGLRDGMRLLKLISI